MDTPIIGIPAESELRILRDAALELVAEAREILKQRFESILERSYKTDGTIVTDVDTAIETKLRAIIELRFPDHGILGEELGAVRPEAPFQWIIDPVDGTENFSRGIPTFGIILGIHYRGVPIVGVIDHPILDLHYSAYRGGGTLRNGSPVTVPALAAGTDPRREVFAMSNPVSYILSGECRPLLEFLGSGINVRIYGDCFAHTRAIEGQVGAMIAVNNKKWDLAASQILVEEAGGRYETLSSTEENGVTKATVIFGKPAVVGFLLDFIAKSESVVRPA